MIRKILMGRIAACGFLVVALAGCDSTIRPRSETLTQYPQVHLTGWNTYNDIQVDKPIVSRVGAGQLEVDVPVHNDTAAELALDYQYRFLGANGAQVEDTSGWANIRIPARSFAQIQFTSMTASSRDFDVTIRPAQ